MRTLGFRTVNPVSQFVMWMHGLIRLRRNVWNPGICRTYDDAVRLALIEPRIADLVASLNVPGIVSTTGCCEGHLIKDCVDIPGVGIRADISFAHALNKALLDASPLGTRILHYHWLVEYNGFGSLMPYIESTSDFDREKLDQDFASLKRIVDSLIAALPR